jgi:hypothetical protein
LPLPTVFPYSNGLPIRAYPYPVTCPITAESSQGKENAKKKAEAQTSCTPLLAHRTSCPPPSLRASQTRPSAPLRAQPTQHGGRGHADDGTARPAADRSDSVAQQTGRAPDDISGDADEEDAPAGAEDDEEGREREEE